MRGRDINFGNPKPKICIHCGLAHRFGLHASEFTEGERESLMARSVMWALVAVIAGVAGCAKNDPGGPVVDGPADLMVLIPAGTFTMGDEAGRPDETPHTG
jgi:hypothetical protein